MKRLLLLSLVLLGGCAGSEFRRVECPLFPEEIEALTAKPEVGTVFSTKTGQLYQWSEFKERYVPDTEWETAVVGEKFKMRRSSPYLAKEVEINFKKLSSQNRTTFHRTGDETSVEFECGNLPIKHPIESPGS